MRFAASSCGAPHVQGRIWVTNGGALGPTFCLRWPSQSLKLSSFHLLLSWQRYGLREERGQEAPQPRPRVEWQQVNPPTLNQKLRAQRLHECGPFSSSSYLAGSSRGRRSRDRDRGEGTVLGEQSCSQLGGPPVRLRETWAPQYWGSGPLRLYHHCCLSIASFWGLRAAHSGHLEIVGSLLSTLLVAIPRNHIPLGCGQP